MHLVNRRSINSLRAYFELNDKDHPTNQKHYVRAFSHSGNRKLKENMPSRKTCQRLLKQPYFSPPGFPLRKLNRKGMSARQSAKDRILIGCEKLANRSVVVGSLHARHPN